MRNVQLGLFALPLQIVAIAQWDMEAVRKDGLLQGFHASTWAVVAVQVAPLDERSLDLDSLASLGLRVVLARRGGRSAARCLLPLSSSSRATS